MIKNATWFAFSNWIILTNIWSFKQYRIFPSKKRITIYSIKLQSIQYFEFYFSYFGLLKYVWYLKLSIRLIPFSLKYSYCVILKLSFKHLTKHSDNNIANIQYFLQHKNAFGDIFFEFLLNMLSWTLVIFTTLLFP